MSMKIYKAEKYQDPDNHIEINNSIYIFVNTQWSIKEKKGATVLALQYYDKFRYIKNINNLREKSEEEQKIEVSNIIKIHYKNSDGKLLLFGKITGYSFVDGSKKTEFDINGEIINQIDISEI